MEPAFGHKAALDAFRSIDIVVHRDGFGWDNVIQKTSAEQFLPRLNIRVFAPFSRLHCSQRLSSGTASSPISATEGNPGQVGYSSGKAKVMGKNPLKTRPA